MNQSNDLNVTYFDGLIFKKSFKHAKELNIKKLFIAKNIGSRIYDFEYGNRKSNKWVGNYTTLTYDYQENEKDYVPVKHMVFNVDPFVGKRAIYSSLALP